MKVRVCHCRQCRYRRAANGHVRDEAIKAAKHNVRQTVRVNLMRGDYEHLPEVTRTIYYA